MQKITFVLLFYLFEQPWVEKSDLVRSEILQLAVNKLTANYEYSRSNREDFLLPIKMQLSEKPKNVCWIVIAPLESKLNFEYFKTQKNEPHGLSIPDVSDSERCAYLNAKRSCLWKVFDSTRVKESPKLLKSAEKYLYLTFWSVLGNVSWKKLFLLRYEILG